MIQIMGGIRIAFALNNAGDLRKSTLGMPINIIFIILTKANLTFYMRR